jgi:hypothetical protein
MKNPDELTGQVSSLLAELPQPHVAKTPIEAGEMRLIHRMAWEGLIRCVERIETDLTPYASWWSFLAGLGASAAVGAVTVAFTGHNPYALILLGLLAVATFFGAYIIKNIEERQQEHETSHLEALKQEMKAAEAYMVALEELEETRTTQTRMA